MKKRLIILIALMGLFGVAIAFAAGGGGHGPTNIHFPPSLDSYQDSHLESIGEILSHRISQSPFNLVASLIFLCAIIHTFLAGKFMNIAHHLEHEHAEKVKRGETDQEDSMAAEVMHFIGEVEVVFGLWVIALGAAIFYFHDWNTVVYYISHKVNYTEPMFVVVIMALASTRPILKFSEICLQKLANIGGATPSAWWLSILTVAPLLGSFITEPAAMTIAALLLSKQFYRYQVSTKLAYATLGLLFVNISVGGTLTHFAAPPVLMVAGPWGWDIAFMFTHFGWKAALGIVIINVIYFAIFKKEMQAINEKVARLPKEEAQDKRPLPAWIVVVHILFMCWTVFNAHNPALFIGGFLFFLGFLQATRPFQDHLSLKGPLLVGFFLAGLVNHGGVQAWWIAPVLGNLGEVPLMLGATVLTAFNDNAAITYLSTLVPSFTDAMKYAVVAGAVTGGGLTVIANAPNPAGQSILSKHFEGGINPAGLALGAVLPTIVMGLSFMLLR